MVERGSVNGAQEELPRWEGFLAHLYYFSQHLKGISIKASEVTDFKKCFFCRGWERWKGSWLKLFSGSTVSSENGEQISRSPAAALSSIESLLQPYPFSRGLIEVMGQGCVLDTKQIKGLQPESGRDMRGEVLTGHVHSRSD